MQILDRICEELYDPKEGVLKAMAVGDPDSVCSHILWSCFRTHDVMASYVAMQFENHPSINSEYIKFLATNSGNNKVENMGLQMKTLKEDVGHQIKALKDEVKEALVKMKAAVTKADVATGRTDTAKTALEVLSKRVTVIENEYKRK